MASTIINNNNSQAANDRQKEVENFENSKLGVKGLVDSGITRIPPIFHYPPEKLLDLQQAQDDGDVDLIPIIDMSIPHPELVEKIREAAGKFGFFQVINHSVPLSLLDRLLEAVKAFHEEVSTEEKVGHYRRDIITTGTGGFGFYSNNDLFTSNAASWRDTISVRLGPKPLNPNDVPNVCRSEIIEWDNEVKQLGEHLLGLLSQGLGLSPDRLKGVPYIGRVAVVGHYYPPCPEPDKTIGLASHTDLGIMTILLQDQVGGLQVKYDGKWINMKPVHGALVINISDLFQILSNDNYVSGEHRVLANSSTRPRVSVGTFFSPGSDEMMHGPLPELVSQDHPALYKQLKYLELQAGFLTKASDSKSIANYFRL